MTTERIEIPDKLVSVFEGKADVRGAWGGRGSAKTRTFAKMTAVRAYMWAQAGREGQILCTRRFMNSLADSSLEEVKAAIRSEAWLEPHFDIGEKYIKTRCGRVRYTFAGLDRNIDSIKSQARILLNWTDEAEAVSEEAWTKLLPTLREEDSECWVTWNPESKRSATHKRFRENADPLYKIAEINWRDNPWFPEVLDRQRKRDEVARPDLYSHIWEGDFVQVVSGAYFAKELTEARVQGRIGQVSRDPLMRCIAFWDIGGTGLNADACSIWIAQWIGTTIRFIDYYEAKGQPLATHVNWLRENGYGQAIMVLPHDGVQSDKVYSASYQGALTQAGFDVRVIKNQGKGAALQRINAARRLFGRMYFDEAKCAGGLEALADYHARIDDERGIDLGPYHGWSSHAADSFGLSAVAYTEPTSDYDDDDDAAYGRSNVTGY